MYIDKCIREGKLRNAFWPLLDSNEALKGKFQSQGLSFHIT